MSRPKPTRIDCPSAKVARSIRRKADEGGLVSCYLGGIDERHIVLVYALRAEVDQAIPPSYRRGLVFEGGREEE